MNNSPKNVIATGLLWFTLSVCLISKNVYANGIDALNNFLQSNHSGISANFSQTVYSRRKNKISNGYMLLKRPDQFKWYYTDNGQIIVSDGKTVSIYDQDLEQITKRKINNNALGQSPAVLLSGETNINKFYLLHNLGESNGVDLVLLLPKDGQNAQFKKLTLGFKQGILYSMSFVDEFDNKTSIIFSNVKTNVTLQNKDFLLNAPSNVDVIQSDS